MTDEAPVLDPAVLDELRDSVGGDEEFIADLVATYVNEGNGHLEAMHGRGRGWRRRRDRPAGAHAQVEQCRARRDAPVADRARYRDGRPRGRRVEGLR